MHDIVAFLVACWQSGTLLRSVCALVVVPVLAWAAIRFIARGIAAIADDPTWQAPLAATAAAIPGALLLTLAAFALSGGLNAACLETFVGRVLFGTIVTVTIVSVARALLLAGRRSSEATALVRISKPAPERLETIAGSCGISARVIADSRSFCALVGTLEPIAIVSEGTLAALTDAELRAALLHERGHARRGDQLISLGLSFLVDLLPLPAMDLVRTYQHAREVAADRHALATAHPHDLAGALLACIRSGSIARGTAALIGTSGMRERLQDLLGETPQKPPSLVHRFAITAALVIVLASGLAPASAALLHPAPCRMDLSALSPH